MKQKQMKQLVKNIWLTQDQEISCSECLDHVSQYVDLELAGNGAAEQMPDVKLHLEQCGVCHEEYLLLRELAIQQQSDELPSPEELKKRLGDDPGI